jgi:hypothetical protein
MANDSNENICWTNPESLPTETDMTKERVPGTPICQHQGDFTLASKYYGAVYDPAAKEVYFLSEQDLYDLNDACATYQQAVEDYANAIDKRNKEVFDKVDEIDQKVQNGDYDDQLPKTPEQNKIALEQQIQTSTDEKTDLEARRESYITGIQVQQKQGVSAYASQVEYQNALIAKQQALASCEARIQTLNTSISQSQQALQYSDVEGYHQAYVDPSNEVKECPDLNQARQNMVDLIKPHINTDDFKELINLSKPTLPKPALKKLGDYHPWNYLLKSAFDKLRNKGLVGIGFTQGEDGEYTFEKTTGQRKSSQSSEITAIDLGDGTASQSNTKSFKPLTFGELKNAILEKQGVSIEDGDYVEKYRESINASFTQLNNTIAKEDNIFNMDVSSEASILRYTSQASLYAGYDPKLKDAGFGEHITADLDVFNGSTVAKGLYPTDQGVEIILQSGSNKISLGVFLLDITIDLHGYAGASAMLSTDVVVSQEAVTDYIKQKIGNVSGDAKANLLNGSMSASGEAGTFAGVSAGCAVTGEIQWAKVTGFMGYKYVVDLDNINSENNIVTKYWGSSIDTNPTMQLLAKLTYSIEADVGAGFHGAYFVGYDKNKGQFTFAISAQICFGAGWKGSFACVIGADAIQQMIVFLYEQFKLTNFDINKLIGAVLQSEAYETISKLIVVAIWTGDAIDSFIKEGQVVMENIRLGFAGIEKYVANLVPDLGARIARMTSEVDLAEKINKADYEVINNATPLAKGHILYHLSQFDPIVFESHPEAVPQAILIILKSIENATDYLEVLTCMVDRQSSETIPATHGAKMLVKNVSLTTNSEIREQFIRVQQITTGQYYQSTDQNIKSNLLAAYQCLSWCAKVSVFVRDNRFDIHQLNNITEADKQAFAMRMQQPNLIL